MNFLSPRPSTDLSPEITRSSPKELFQRNDDDDQAMYNSEERRDIFEALRTPIVPDKEFLTRTLPVCELSSMLEIAQSKKGSTEAVSNVMTCAQCVMGKEENRKQNLLHKADKMVRRTLQKGYNRLDKELRECREILDNKTKEVVVLTQRLKTKEDAETVGTNGAQSPEIVEEIVKTAGDFMKCECYNIKVKGMVKLLKHQQTAYFTCNMCNENKWVGLSIEHLNIHQKNTHKVRVTKQKCDPCQLVFLDAMAKNVHKLKEHNHS